MQSVLVLLMSLAVPGGCNAPQPDNAAAERSQRDIDREFFEHAIRCLGVTLSVAALSNEELKREARRLHLDRIEPEIARRWFSIARQAARRAQVSAPELSDIVKRNITPIERAEQLAPLGDEAFECASEVDVPDPTAL